jgi:thioredoxin-like negative regulator of GroEL
MEAAGVEVQIVDIDANPELMRKYDVTSVPTFYVYVCGQKTARTQDIAVVVSLTRIGH